MATYTIPQGDDRIIVHTLSNGGQPFDIAGSSIYWRLFLNAGDADAAALYTRTWLNGVESGLSRTDPETGVTAATAAGVLYNRMTSAVTAALLLNTTYYYELKLTSSLGFVTTVDTGTLGVVPSPGTTAPSGLTPTKAELRRRVADRFGDYTALTATSAGTTTSLVDTLDVNAGAETFNGRVLRVTSGVNAGATVRVTATTAASGTLTFTPALPSSVAAGTSFDVFNKRGIGFTPAEYDRAINNAINDAWPLGLVPLVATISTGFDSDVPEVAVPTAMSLVDQLEYRDAEGWWHVVEPASRGNAYGWTADAPAGQIRLRGTPATMANGLSLRLSGYGRQSPLVSDSDTCSLNAEYVVSRACYHLALGAMMRDPSFGTQANAFMNEAASNRTRLRTLREPSVQQVRP